MDELAARNFTDLPRGAFWIADLALLTEIATSCEDAKLATSLYNLLLPYAQRLVLPSATAVSYGSASYYLGILATLLGRWQDADRHFAEAVATHEGGTMSGFLARTRYAYAEMLVRRDEPRDQERALQLVGQVLEAGQELGRFVWLNRRSL